ncbi:CatB-related O-acetyltransferase [Streptomyces sp. CO7]
MHAGDSRRSSPPRQPNTRQRRPPDLRTGAPYGCPALRLLPYRRGSGSHRPGRWFTRVHPTLLEPGGSWADHFDLLTGLPGRGDTVVGNAVWFGHGTTVMPGARIGHGAIIGAGAVVTSDVPDYGIVGGNPARLIRIRYGADDVARLLAVAWWDWPVEHITGHVRTIMSGSVDELEAAAPDARPR